MEVPHCEECGWEGDWIDCHVEQDNGIGPDPECKHPDPPYYCPECGECLG